MKEHLPLILTDCGPVFSCVELNNGSAIYFADPTLVNRKPKNNDLYLDQKLGPMIFKKKKWNPIYENNKDLV